MNAMPFVLCIRHFRTLLGATAKHPAMLFYLDNWMSTVQGYEPRNKRGRVIAAKAKQGSGLNEITRVS